MVRSHPRSRATITRAVGTDFGDLDDVDSIAGERREVAPDAGVLFADRYRLQRVIGRGGAGVVWEAIDERSSGEPAAVAIKIVALGSALREARASREIAIGRGLTGPGFVRVFDAGLAHPHAFVVMERLVGEDLANRLDRVGKLDVQETLHISRQLANALGVAHATGLVHRDLKPTNVFLVATNDAARDVVKLLDFGVAKRLGVDARVTASNTLLGAPQYSAPEQLSSAPRVDTRADVWSMAAIVYRCLLGRRPFDGQGAELLTKVISDPHPPPATIDPSLPRGLEGVFARGLAKQPDHRYATASMFVHDLERVLFGWR